MRSAGHHRGLRRRQPQRHRDGRSLAARPLCGGQRRWRATSPRHLLPRTRAWHEIWLDEEKIAGGVVEDEPILGRTYLPRKFKIAIALPPHNDVDVFAHDLGFIAIVQRGSNYRLQRGGWRRHGDDPWRAGNLSAHRRRDRLLQAGATRWTWRRRSSPSSAITVIVPIASMRA